jgi:hypothetical protein
MMLTVDLVTCDEGNGCAKILLSLVSAILFNLCSADVI